MPGHWHGIQHLASDINGKYQVSGEYCRILIARCKSGLLQLDPHPNLDPSSPRVLLAAP